MINPNTGANLLRPAASAVQTQSSRGDAAVIAPVETAYAAPVEDPEETEVKRAVGNGWWSPGMLANEVAGYEEADDTLSYGMADFCSQ